MRRDERRSKLIMRFTTAAVFTAIAVLSLLQYKWAVNSAEKTISDLAKSYENRIFGTIAQEISHLELFNSRPTRNTLPEQDNIKKSLEYIWEQFYSYYDKPFLLSINFYNQDDNIIQSSSDGKTWINRTRPFSFEFPVSKNGENDFRDLFLIRDPDKKGIIYIVHSYHETSNFSIIELDMDNFLKKGLIPVINESFGDISIEVPTDLAQSGIGVNDKDYRFSPLKTLFSYLTDQVRIYYLSIPYIRFPLYRFPKEAIMRPPDEISPEILYISIRSDSGESLFFERELSISVQWLTGVILLLGIAIAYSLILFQKSRLTSLRRKEKEFVATITHELRTPLTVIHSAADNIQSGILNKERLSQYGDLIKDQSKRLSSMIEGILLFSRLEGKAEQIPISRKVDFRSVQEEIEVFFASLNNKRNHKLSIDFGSLPSSAVLDRDTLVLILTNLITNSFRHAYSSDNMGEIRLTARLKLPSTLNFIVEDDGCGISRKEQKHLFEPFFRGERSRNEQIKGSGLGLYLVERKARLIGSSIKVESPYMRADCIERRGTRFILSLPFDETGK